VRHRFLAPILVLAALLAGACADAPAPVAGLDSGPPPTGPLAPAVLPIPFAADDAWDVSTGVVVTATSGVLSPFTWPPQNVFGNGGAGGETLFADFRPAGTVHWIEWRAPEARAIESFTLVAMHDGHISTAAPRCPLPFPYRTNRDAHHRGMDHFTLKAWNPGTAAFDVVLYAAAVPLGDDDAVHPGEGAMLYDPDGLYHALKLTLVLESAIPVVSTDRWRAEFRQLGCPSSESGPRIRELDGFVSEVVEVDIDIKPGGDPNPVNCGAGNAVIPVAILTTPDFDATTVDHATVRFAGAAETHGKPGAPKRHEEDVDGDGDVDLVLHFRVGETDLDCDSTEATLTGETFDGTPIEGSGPLKMVGSG
jgi:hypothetical protein